jgi:hypothetical protein
MLRESGDGWRDFLDISHLNRTPLPSGQDLLNPLAEKPMPLRYPVTAPAQQEIELYGLALEIGPVMFGKCRNLRGKADAILPDFSPQFVQGKLFNVFRILVLGARPSSIDGQRPASNWKLDRLLGNRFNSGSHGASLVCGEIHKKGIKMAVRRALAQAQAAS